MAAINTSETNSLWWDWPTEGWKETEGDLSYVDIIREGVRVNSILCEKLDSLLHLMNGDPSKVTKAFALSNRTLLQSFESCRKNITKQHQRNPHLFKKTNWSEFPDADLRKEINDYLVKYVANFGVDWNNHVQVSLWENNYK